MVIYEIEHLLNHFHIRYRYLIELVRNLSKK